MRGDIKELRQLHARAVAITERLGRRLREDPLADDDAATIESE